MTGHKPLSHGSKLMFRALVTIIRLLCHLLEALDTSARTREQVEHAREMNSQILVEVNRS